MKLTRTFFLITSFLLAVLVLLVYHRYKEADQRASLLQSRLDDIDSLLADQEDSTMHYLERLRFYRTKSQLDDLYFREFFGPALRDSLVQAYREIEAYSEFEGLLSRRLQFHQRFHLDIRALSTERDSLLASRLIALDEIRKLNAAHVDSGQELIDHRRRLTDARDSISMLQQAITSFQTKSKDAAQLLEFTRDGNTVYYIGDRTNSAANGYGFAIWSTGGMYKGDWKNNRRHGKGWYKWMDGEVYEGDFHEDKRQGSGKYTFKNGEYYTGEWMDNKRHGFGTIYAANGTIKYQGHWENDKLVRSTLPSQ
jgi:hypothetical protein